LNKFFSKVERLFFLSEMGWIRKIKRLYTREGGENAKMHPIESDLLPLKMTCFLVYQLSSLASQYRLKKSYSRSVCSSSEKRFCHSEFIETIQVVKPLKFNQYWKSLTKFKNYWNYGIFSKRYKWSNYLFGIVLSLLWSIAWSRQPISED
jgi:hypothetical protein